MVFFTLVEKTMEERRIELYFFTSNKIILFICRRALICRFCNAPITFLILMLMLDFGKDGEIERSTSLACFWVVFLCDLVQQTTCLIPKYTTYLYILMLSNLLK